MADDIEYTRHRYDLFWQLDYQVSAYGPDDVTAEMAEKLLAALKAISSGRRAEKPGDPTQPSSTTIDLTARAQRRIDTPTWEDTWTRFKQDIRNERIRLGRELGIDPEPTLPLVSTGELASTVVSDPAFKVQSMTTDVELRAYKFALDVTPAQLTQLRQHAGAARWVYNHALGAKFAALDVRRAVITTLVEEAA
jgi:hypothetical protein